MTDSQRDPDPAPEDEAPAIPDGPLTPEEAEDDPAYDPVGARWWTPVGARRRRCYR